MQHAARVLEESPDERERRPKISVVYAAPQHVSAVQTRVKRLTLSDQAASMWSLLSVSYISKLLLETIVSLPPSRQQLLVVI